MEHFHQLFLLEWLLFEKLTLKPKNPRKPMRKSFFIPVRLALALVTALAVSAITSHAQITASGTISAAAAGGGSFDYTITLHNSAASTASIETLWYAWIPGQFYLPSVPTSTAFPLPSGWSANVVTVAPNESSIQFLTTTAPLAPGGSLSFTYASVDTPAQEFGNSANYAGNPPVGTSFVYQGGPFSGAQAEFVIQPVPEPSSLALLGVGSLALLATFRRGKLARSAQV